MSGQVEHAAQEGSHLTSVRKQEHRAMLMLEQATKFKACLQQPSSSKQPHPPQLHLPMSSQMLTPLMNETADNASLLVM